MGRVSRGGPASGSWACPWTSRGALTILSRIIWSSSATDPMRFWTSVEQRKDLESLTHLQPLTPQVQGAEDTDKPHSCTQDQFTGLSLLLIRAVALTVFPQPPALVVYLLVSFSIMALFFSFFLNVVSCSGIGASGSCSALVSVGQKLCEAGGIRCIGSCSTCSEGLNTDASRWNCCYNVVFCLLVFLMSENCCPINISIGMWPFLVWKGWMLFFFYGACQQRVTIF